MPIPTGTVYFSQIRSELYAGTGGGYPLGASMPLNDATFRSRLTNTSQNAPVGISAIRGNAYQRFTIAADTVYYNIYNALIAAGWNGVNKGSVDLIVNGGIVVSSASTGAYAMDTGGPWPGPSSINLYNYGYIVGMGGNGGPGGRGGPGSAGSTPGTAGGGGGPGLLVQRALYLVNGGQIAGGGGGGGGGDGYFVPAETIPLFGTIPSSAKGGGGGGGGATSRYASAGGAGGAAPGSGNPQPGDPGGNGGFGSAGAGATRILNGGAGGGWGAAGATGERRNTSVPFPQGGAGGISIQGWSAVTAAPSGTVYGSVSG